MYIIFINENIFLTYLYFDVFYRKKKKNDLKQKRQNFTFNISIFATGIYVQFLYT